MVGIAGRSRACGNCRKRHIRCDEARPTCKRCTKANLECEGYRDLTVIQYSGGPTRNQKSSTPSPSSRPTSNSTQIVSFNDVSPGRGLAPDPDDVFRVYTFTHLLKGNQFLDPSWNFFDRKLADQSFLALATSYFGHEHRERSIVERGTLRYSTALSELHRALADTKHCTSYDVLESILFMGFFEFLMAKTKDGWIAHGMGLEKLIELRGPESFQNMPDRLFFQTSRTTIIFASLVLRRPTVLSQQRWKDVPWALDPSQKNLIQYLLDILVECPGLLALRDRAHSVMEDVEQQQLIEQFLAQTYLRLEQLALWKSSWDAVESGCCYELPASGDTPTCTLAEGLSGPAWETVWSYNTLYHANTLALYHATRISLLINAQYFTPETAYPDLMQAKCLSGIEICRSMEYHLQMMREGAGSFYILFPLRMAWEAIGTTEPAIGAWLLDVLKKIETGAAGRWALAGYLLEINKPTGRPDGRVDDLVS